MNVLVIDGQGGGIGKLLVSGIKSEYPDFFVTAVGANSIATSAMLKAGADAAATGENAVCVGCRKADVIAGPVGIVIADALLGEITPKMAAAMPARSGTWRRVTLAPMGMPARSLNVAMDLRALVTRGCWPAMAASSLTATSSALGLSLQSPRPMLITILSIFGIWLTFL